MMSWTSTSRPGEGDRNLAERLDTEIYAHNAETTGLRDGRLLTVKATSDGAVVGGLSGGN